MTTIAHTARYVLASLATIAFGISIQ